MGSSAHINKPEKKIVTIAHKKPVAIAYACDHHGNPYVAVALCSYHAPRAIYIPLPSPVKHLA